MLQILQGLRLVLARIGAVVQRGAVGHLDQEVGALIVHIPPVVTLQRGHLLSADGIGFKEAQLMTPKDAFLFHPLQVSFDERRVIPHDLHDLITLFHKIIIQAGHSAMCGHVPDVHHHKAEVIFVGVGDQNILKPGQAAIAVCLGIGIRPHVNDHGGVHPKHGPGAHILSPVVPGILAQIASAKRVRDSLGGAGAVKHGSLHYRISFPRGQMMPMSLYRSFVAGP